MVGKTNVGGAKPFGYIFVTYPAGSSAGITTDGNDIILADTKTGVYVFPVPYAGTWLVACWDGADFDSSANQKYEIVTISAENPYATVELMYIKYLFRSGVGAVESCTTGYNSGGSISVGTESISFTNGNNTAAWWQVDVTDFEKLYVEVAFTKNNASPDWAWVCGLSIDAINEDGAGGFWKMFDAYHRITDGTFSRATVSVDISQFSGVCYIGFAQISTGDVYNVYLE